MRMLATTPSSGGMKELPKNVVKYSQVPKGDDARFTKDKIPKGLLKERTTKAGTW
jgi:tellurite resistance-related uncharacterized protein